MRTAAQKEGKTSAHFCVCTFNRHHTRAIQPRARTHSSCLLQCFLPKDTSVNSLSCPAPWPGRLSSSYRERRGPRTKEGLKIKPSPGTAFSTDLYVFIIWAGERSESSRRRRSKPGEGGDTSSCFPLAYLTLLNRGSCSGTHQTVPSPKSFPFACQKQHSSGSERSGLGASLWHPSLGL